MKPIQDNADPEVGPASDPLTPRNNEETPAKAEPPVEVNKDELIPLTHAPPLSTQGTSESNDSKSVATAPNIRLMHPFLLKVPMQIRYTIYGALSSALFMVMYNEAVKYLGNLYVPSTLYAATYLVFIPIQHAMASTMVFGWPDRYLPSLTSNVPIGLTAIALGAWLTAYLDKVDFDETVESLLVNMGLVKLPTQNDNKPPKESSSEFYTSLFVLVVTSLWSFILSVLVNTPADTPDKKEL